MIHNVNYFILIFIFTFLNFHIALAQSPTKYKEVSLKKGQVLDVLLISQNPDTETDLKTYFETAFPIAQSMSYQSLPGFKIVEQTQGNHRPGRLILGQWSDIVQREEFLTKIVEAIPDFHEQRRAIWSYFGLRYFEIQKNVTFRIDRSKYHVATAYWLAPGEESSEFIKHWKKKLKWMGGEILIQLEGGTSPFGYSYDPEYLVITSWKDKATFDAFQAKMQKVAVDQVSHINEFILQ